MSGQAAGGAVVFLGPTLPAAEAAARWPFRVLPPARQGDVFRAVRAHRPRAIGLIDGVFLDVPSVWHRELLWAMAQGVHVYGAASMGALRAAELHGFGMQGIGRVFQAYRDGVWPGFPQAFEDDDEVAVLHAPAAVGGAALCDAMVDIRATLLAAETAGVIGRAECLARAACQKRLHFPLRRLTALGLGDWLHAGRVPQKRLDAEALLHAMLAAQPSWSVPFRPEFRFERALVWARFEAAGQARERDARAAALLQQRGAQSLRKEDVDAWLR